MHNGQPRRVMCPYCDKQAVLTDSAVIYGESYGMIWLCRTCRAYVGVHKGDKNYKPLGRLANAELREWKKRAHAAFDPVWQEGKRDRSAAYSWLANEMGLSWVEDCHIGLFDVEQCKKVVEICTGDPFATVIAEVMVAEKQEENKKYHRKE